MRIVLLKGYSEPLFIPLYDISLTNNKFDRRDYIKMAYLRREMEPVGALFDGILIALQPINLVLVCWGDRWVICRRDAWSWFS